MLRRTYQIRHAPRGGMDIPITYVIARSETDALARFWSGMEHCSGHRYDGDKWQRYRKQFYAIKIVDRKI